jgi:hypothetical protein
MNGRTPQHNSISDFLSALQRLPTAMSGYYWSEAMNPTIRLGTFQAELKAGGIRDKRRAVASLVCEPSPRIVYEALEGVSTEFFFAAFEHRDIVTVPHLEEVPDRPHGVRFPDERFSGSLPPTEVGSGRALEKVRFVVFNFPDVVGHAIRNKTAMRASRLVLASDRWTVAMDGVRDLGNRLRQARARGAYIISHAGEMRATDGSAFSSDEAQDVLTALYYLMSFACGARTGPALPVGYAKASRKPAWAHWAVRAIDPYEGTFAWFDKHHPESLSAIFEPFLRKWHDARNRDMLRRVISGFVQAHDPDPIENSIVAIQIALETLSWFIKTGPPTEPGAGGRIAKLLSESGIPAEIPPSMSSLRSAAASHRWAHGPHAIVEIRNDIVHSDRSRVVDLDVLVDAWRLSLWYLELVLLRWLGYEGVHNRRIERNRVTGKVEPVPWTRPGMPS